MPLIDVPLNIREESLPYDVSEFIDEANQRIHSFIAERKVRISGFVPSEFGEVYKALVAVVEDDLATGNTFCEWGCGFGVVAMLAAIVEFQSYGIEIEDSLIQEARTLADDYELPVDFVTGSFIPAGGDEIVEEMFSGEISWLSGQIDHAYSQLGLSANDFDVVYAFPWPGEEGVIAALFDAFASTGALLLTFEDIGGVRARRRVVRR